MMMLTLLMMMRRRSRVVKNNTYPQAVLKLNKYLNKNIFFPYTALKMPNLDYFKYLSAEYFHLGVWEDFS